LRASEPEPGALISVVLAAGRGQRFGGFAGELPKALLPVLGKALVVAQLEALRALGVRESVLVVGHRQERIRALLGDGASLGLALRYVEQPEPLGIAHALGCAAALVTRPFLCLLGDVVFEPADLARVAAGLAGADAVVGVRAVEDAREVARNFAVERDAQGFARAVVEKPRQPRPGWKGIGLYAFRPEFLELARATPPSALRSERELTDAIQRHIEAGARVRAVACEGRDFNLSEPADLLAANLHALERAGLERFVEPSAVVAPGARLERAVVLAGAEVAAGAELVRALVFPGERVPPGSYADAVFCGGAVLACPPRA
jgi:glucose-1-phosphate thymidylyltransferase